MFAFSSIRLIFISHKKVHLQTQAKTGDQGKWNDKITWKNVDAEEINFGPYTDESNEGATIEEEATTEEEANNRKAMGKPQWKWKCRTPWSMKREASDPLGLLDLELTSKRPQTRDTSKEEDGYEGDEDSDYIRGLFGAAVEYLLSTRPV